jgi:anti-sigma B factor antagonist
MNLSIDRHAVNGAVRLAIAGEVDIATAGQLRRAILTALTDVRTEELTVDLDQVTFLDSSGIQTLLRGHGIAAERGIAFRVTNRARSSAASWRSPGFSTCSSGR